VTAQPDKLGALFDALREDFSQIAFLLRAAAQATFLRHAVGRMNGGNDLAHRKTWRHL
jgi:hypothetical protein